MTDRRPAGHGSLETLPSGRVRARIVLADGERHNLGTHASHEDGEGVIAAALELAAASKLAPVGGTTLLGWGRHWLDELELSRRYAAMPTARSIWRCHVEAAPFVDWPIRRINAPALRRWFEKLQRRPDLSDSYVSQILSLIRKCFQAAMLDGKIETNPAREVQLAKGRGVTHEPWTYLRPDEQRRLAASEAIPLAWRLQIQFAIGTGLRSGEQRSLRLDDLVVDGSDPHVVVRYGRPTGPTKARRIRTVPLFGVGLDAARRWLEVLPSWTTSNPNRLVFPGERGGFQKAGNRPDGWTDWMAAAGIDRRVRWHDLRHTCAASLISGWWGRDWRLEEIRDLLGHAHVEETERYAHLAETALRRAAAETRAADPTPIPRAPERLAATGTYDHVGVSDGGSHDPEPGRDVTTPIGQGVGRLGALARLVLTVLADGGDAGPAAEALARAVAGTREVQLALAVLAGGPFAGDRAVELARVVLEGEGTEAVRKAVG